MAARPNDSIAEIAPHRMPQTGLKPGPLKQILGDKRAKFLLAGGLNTVFGFACFVAYQQCVGHRWGYMWTLFLTHITTVLFAFVTHRSLVFKVTGSLFRDLWRFESVYLVGLGVNALLLPFAVEVLESLVLMAQLGLTALNAVLSWLGHSRFSFVRHSSSAA
ncbi:GtrA family protein [Terrabacter sp. NPDC080008]|uniref:GtrA family protein n=1 Tax=Terrabacter sp. NPDC080008 TaxID=3155176 RepID=UPI00344C1B93